MRIVISGASGFVGRMLLERLLHGSAADGTPVVDQVPTDVSIVALVHKPASLVLLKEVHPDLEVHRLDGWDDMQLESIVLGADVFFHLAWSSVPRIAAQDPARDVRENVEGGLRLLNGISNAGVRRFVFLSSGGTVYGSRTGAPITEDVPVDPTNAYACGKVCFEQYLRERAEYHGFEQVILRPSNLYGDPSGPTKQQGVVEHWFGSIAAGRAIDAWHGLDVTRDYLHIDDIVDVLIAAMSKPVQASTFNVGTGIGTSLSELLSHMFEITGVTVPVHSPGKNSPDLPWNVLDPGLLQRSWGITPKVPLRSGLERTWRSLQRRG